MRRLASGALTLAALVIVRPAPLAQQAAAASMDRDLLEVTIPKLESLYQSHRYTVTQVTWWYLDRIDRYNDVYRAILHIDRAGALATAAAEDAAARQGGERFTRPSLWGVPVVIKSNTSVKGLVTSQGWKGYLVPGHELVAPMDATIVAKLRAAGVVILGQTNMPDFAASDTNISTAFGRTGNAYDWRFSPGGSSGGTVTAVAGNLALFGTGTDTANSIRMPAATSALVGMMPTRGLVSIAGIGPLDWLRDNTGPITRTVTDAAIALGVMAGDDPRDTKTLGSAAKAQPAPYTKYLDPGALRGRRFGVPAFIVKEPPAGEAAGGGNLEAETRQVFMRALDGMRAAGATIVEDPNLLPDSFSDLISKVNTRAYRREGTERFLRDFGPSEYRTPEAYEKAVGQPLPATIIGADDQRTLEDDPEAETTFYAPQRAALAAYDAALDRFKLDGLVYPGLQVPSIDETVPGATTGRSKGPHSNTGWVNRIGVPAIVVPGGYYSNGLPFGLELSARAWKDGDLLGWAFAYEQATKHRRPPALVDQQK
jgi:Asp-tRNA(Asn)/Glu-tRNA(Gln) amidotransferase A subunit family amidase